MNPLPIAAILGLILVVLGCLLSRMVRPALYAVAAVLFSFQLSNLILLEHDYLNAAFPSSCPYFTKAAAFVYFFIIAFLAVCALKSGRGRVLRLGLLLVSAVCFLSPIAASLPQTYEWFDYQGLKRETETLRVGRSYCANFWSDILFGFGDYRRPFLYEYGIYGTTLPPSDGSEADKQWREHAEAAAVSVREALAADPEESGALDARANAQLELALEKSTFFPANDARRAWTFRTTDTFARHCYAGCKDVLGQKMYSLCKKNGYPTEPWCIRGLIMHCEESLLPW